MAQAVRSDPTEGGPVTALLTPQDLTTLCTVADPAVSDDGRFVCASVHDAPPADGAAPRADLWLASHEGPARPVTSGPGVDALPRFSPSGRRLAFGSDRAVPGLRGLHLVELDDAGTPIADPRHVAAVTGAVEDIHWSKDERHLLLRVADPGSDTGNVGGAIRFSAGSDGLGAAAVEVHRPGTYRRRAVLLDLATEEVTPVSPGDLTVWDLGWSGAVDGPIAALVSADPTESGWYDADVALLGGGRAEIVYRTQWQLQEPVVSPDGRRVAVLEAPQSDRALLSGEVVIIDLGTRSVVRVPLDADVSRLRWLSDGDLFWAGRSGLDAVLGRVTGIDAGDVRTRELWRGRQTLGSTYRVQAVASADGSRVAAPRQAHGVPWELAVLDPAVTDPAWHDVTDVNAHAVAWPAPEEDVFAWTGDDGQEIHGLLLTPSRVGSEPLPLVVVPHGGPTNASTSVFASGAHGGDALLLTQAGCAVLIPNPRGSVGRGRAFMAANIGDLGGGDLRDIEAGVAALVAAGRVDPARVGIVGLSYGGFMSAWAAVRSRVFTAAIPIAGISDWLSFHHTSNQGRMDEIFLASSPYDAAGRHLERSPVMHVRGCTTATLILHGDADLACPIGQAQELYQGLADAGCPVEYVVYRGAGHGMTTREHRVDVQERILAWFGEHLGLGPVPG